MAHVKQRPVRAHSRHPVLTRMPARPQVLGLVLLEHRRMVPALVRRARAAGRERAPRFAQRQVRRLARHSGKRRMRRVVQTRDRVQQRARVGHSDVREQHLRRSPFDRSARVHHHHLVGEARRQPEIVADHDQPHPEPLLQVSQQLHDLRLGRHIERGRGLVGDQQPGRGRQRDRDHHPLAHAARQLMRILRESLSAAGSRTSSSSSSARSCAAPREAFWWVRIASRI